MTTHMCTGTLLATLHALPPSYLITSRTCTHLTTSSLTNYAAERKARAVVFDVPEQEAIQKSKASSAPGFQACTTACSCSRAGL